MERQVPRAVFLFEPAFLQVKVFEHVGIMPREYGVRLEAESGFR